MRMPSWLYASAIQIMKLTCCKQRVGGSGGGVSVGEWSGGVLLVQETGIECVGRKILVITVLGKLDHIQNEWAGWAHFCF